jgi:ribonucleoside-triphosphate reductase
MPEPARQKYRQVRKGQAFAVRMMNYLRGLLEEIQEETGEFFNIEATPGEGTTYRLALLDQKRFPDCNFANTAQARAGAAPFYTNFPHLPVEYSDDIFDALDHQDALQSLYTGGTVLHGFFGEEITDTGIVRDLVRKITDKYPLPYFTLTPTFSVCPDHGYIKGQVPVCPSCGGETEVYSRIVGYLRPVNRWNNGKRCEWKQRKTYKVADISKEDVAAMQDVAD